MDRIREHAIPKMSWSNSPKKWVMYAWYYQTFAMFQHGGKHWKEWNAVFQEVLMKNQHPEGYWSHELAWGAGKGMTQKAYQTSLSALMLTVYYRYLSSSKFSFTQSESSARAQIWDSWVTPKLKMEKKGCPDFLFRQWALLLLSSHAVKGRRNW